MTTIPSWAWKGSDDPKDPVHLLDQGRTQRLRKLSRRGPDHLPHGSDHAAENGGADIAKPLKGLGSGDFEIALPLRGNAFRVVYAVQIADEIRVLHAFQKKSTQGIKTPRHEIELVENRLKRLKEALQ